MPAKKAAKKKAEPKPAPPPPLLAPHVPNERFALLCFWRGLQLPEDGRLPAEVLPRALDCLPRPPTWTGAGAELPEALELDGASQLRIATTSNFMVHGFLSVNLPFGIDTNENWHRQVY